MPEKLATLGLLKIKIFWNKGYDVKILSCDSDYIKDVVIRPKFGIPMREVNITSIL